MSDAPPQRDASPPRQSILRRAWGTSWSILLTAVVLVIGVWAIAALSLTDLDGAAPRIFAPILFGLAFLYVLILFRPRWRGRLIAVAMAIPVAVWYFTRFASNDRAWSPRHATLATATIDGDRVTIHKYRLLEPGEGGRLEEKYVDRTFNLNDLVRTDLIMSYWGPTEIAHALVCFEFSDGSVVAESIEVRTRASQKSFDMARSLFRNFELIYVVGSERAVIGPGILDDRHRVFLYRTNISAARTRALFLQYARKLNELAADPEWYNAITDNCTTGIYMHLRRIPPPPPFSIWVLLNGYLPEYVYQHGSLDSSLPWADLNQRCDIKQIGRRAYNAPDFSRIIREQVPAPAVHANPDLALS